MIDFKKMDDKDFVFVNKPLSEKKEKEFSNFLKSRRTKTKGTRSPKNQKSFTTNSTNRQHSITRSGA